MVIDCYVTHSIMHSITTCLTQCEYKDTLLNVNIKILLFDKLLLDFETLNCQYG